MSAIIREWTGGTVRTKWRATVANGQVFVPLSGGGHFRVLPEDFDFVRPYTWWRVRARNTSYASTQRLGRQIFAHRLILGVDQTLVVDHIDRDGLNNLRSNLRACSRTENNRYRISLAGKSRFKGAAYHRHSGLYHSTIHVNGKQLSLGYFQSEVDAARAYDIAAKKHFGEFALTNNALGNFDD